MSHTVSRVLVLPVMALLLLAAAAAISVTKTPATTSVNVSDPLMFVINVTNDDASSYENYTLHDYYNTTYLTFVGANGTYSNGTAGSLGEVAWDFNLSVGQSFVVTINFTTLKVGVTNNTALVDNESGATQNASLANITIIEAYALNYTNTTDGSLEGAIDTNTTVLVEANNTMSTSQTYNFTLELPENVTGTVNGSTTLATVALGPNKTTTLNVTVQANASGSYTFNVLGILANDSSVILNSSEDITLTLTAGADAENPNTTLEGPANGFLTNTSVTFNCSATDNINLSNITLTVWEGGTVNVSNTTSVTGTAASAAWTYTLDNGTYTWNCQANDTSGNSDWGAANRVLYVDTLPPWLNASVNDSIVQNATNVTITVNATDFNGVTNVTADATQLAQSGTIWSGTLTLTAPSGSISIVATDAANNTNTTSVAYTVDDTAPLIQAANLSDNNTQSGTIVTVTVNASDPNGVASVSADGTALANQSGTIWNGSITLSTSPVNITVTDEAGNTNTTTIPYTIDDTSPAFSAVTADSTAATDDSTITVTVADGNITLNWTLTELHLKSANLTIDGSVRNASLANGTGSNSYVLDGGSHSVVLRARDEAQNTGTHTFTLRVNRDVNLTSALDRTRAKLGSRLLNVTVRNATDDLSSNTTRVNRTLNMSYAFNATRRITVEVLNFDGLDANWNRSGNYSVNTNESGSAATTHASAAGITAEHFVDYQNMSRFLNESAFTLVHITFNQSMANRTLFYIASSLYKAVQCTNNAAPTSVTESTACYTNTTQNVTLHAPHLSGAILGNDTEAPALTINEPGATENDSIITVGFSVVEANPAATFCRYNVTNTTTTITSATLTTGDFSQSGVNYTYSETLTNLSDGDYNFTVNCTDTGGRSNESIHAFSVADATAPTITSPGRSVDTTEATITWTTNEEADSKISYGESQSLGTDETSSAHTTSHSVEVTGLSAGTTYYYNITSCDRAGNCATSGYRTLTTDAATTTSSGGGGGGGGDPATSYSTLSSSPLRVTLSSGGQFTFELQNGIETKVRVQELSDSATLSFPTSGERVTLAEGESADVDVTGDGVADVHVEMKSVSYYNAFFEMTTATVEADAFQAPEPAENVTTTEITTEEPTAASEPAAPETQDSPEPEEDTEEGAEAEADEGGGWIVMLLIPTIILLLVVGYFAVKTQRIQFD